MKSTQMHLFVWGMVMLGCASLQPLAQAQCDPEQFAKLLASDGAPESEFGGFVSIEGDTAVVGAELNDDNGENSGAAYIYYNVGGPWTEDAKLVASDGSTNDQFGHCVSISGHTAIVGAVFDSDNGEDSGAAYMYEKIGGIWTEVAKLLASDGAADDQFGYSVSIDGHTALVGAQFGNGRVTDSGSVYVFEKIGGVWTEIAKLLASDGAVGDGFGRSVSIDGDSAVVGSEFDSDNGRYSGAAYVFNKINDKWTEVAKLLPSDGAERDSFGCSVSISEDAAIVGAYLSNRLGTNSGSAYIFKKIGGLWTEVAQLLAPDGAAEDRFGNSVSISGDAAIVGAYWDERTGRGYQTGSAYVYERTSGAWTAVAKLLASDGAAGDFFGRSVSIDGDSVIVGAFRDRDLGYNAGSAYVFHLRCGPPQLSVTATCPSGGPIQVTWSGATWRGRVALLYASGTGSFVIPNNHSCAGTVLGLGKDQLETAFHGVGGRRGRGHLNSTIQPSACGGYLQLLDLSTCGTSNVARIE